MDALFVIERRLNMENNTANPIKEYYIAYFDILGYKAFFEGTPEKAPEFLNIVNSAISNTLATINSANDSQLASQFANMHIQSKIFSDNVLLCIEVGDDATKEKSRILTFMGLISEIQRRFIKYGLFLRGGFTKGKMSINDDYIFGEGLIEAVKMEESTFHPRIAVSEKIIAFLETVKLYSQEDAERAISIENRTNNGETISDEDNEFKFKFIQLMNQEILQRNLSLNLLYRCADEVWCLSYLYSLDIRAYMPEQALSRAMEIMKQLYPSDYEKLPKSFPDIDAILASHKQKVEQKLTKYSNYTSLTTDNIKGFESQERVLKKYVWSMVYHNHMCDRYNKPEHFINTQANCEQRHMKLVIHVLAKEEKTSNT